MHKVLVVADARWVTNDVTAVIDAPRRRIITESDPRRAVAEAAKHQPDVIVVDMQVGSMGGMAVVRALKAAAHAGTVPSARLVLLLDRQADEFIARRAGADSWVVKPFSAHELRAALAEQAAAPA